MQTFSKQREVNFQEVPFFVEAKRPEDVEFLNCLLYTSTTGISIQASYVHQNKPFAKIQDGMTAIPYGEIYDENGNVNPYPCLLYTSRCV